MSQVNPDNTCANLYKTYKYPQNPIKFMFDTQVQLQKFMNEKRGTLSPYTKYGKETIDESIYYWQCTCTEYFEFLELLSKHNYNLNDMSKETILELQYEIIDMWHFIMNQFIYIDSTFSWDLRDLFDKAIFNLKSRDLHFHQNISDSKKLEYQIALTWSELSYSWSELMNNLQYKHWKTYKDFVKDDTFVQVLGFEIIRLFLEIGYLVGLNAEIFFNLYMSKNEENIKRQTDSTKGYI